MDYFYNITYHKDNQICVYVVETSGMYRNVHSLEPSDIYSCTFLDPGPCLYGSLTSADENEIQVAANNLL